ncbi:osteopontin [Clinocottus analis]|uniref:osteopontin n=1 Tax=Clinocottus analis TaxID=304258 RepID=UPI0035BF9EC5
MKVAVVFVLLFATVLCRPARKVTESSSESSEEMMRQPAQPLNGKLAEVPQESVAPVQNVAAAAGSDESTASSDEDEQAAADALVDLESASTDTTSSPDTASVSQDSEDSDDDDDDDDTEESETEEDETSESSESGESSTIAPTTVDPVIVTEEPFAETTAEPIVPTIVTDQETARGDSLGGYPSDYKSIIYVEDKSYHKAPYKSYEYMGKKMAYDMTKDNEVDKSPKAYKALQIHNDILEEDTSTPEMESQGLDVSFNPSKDQDLSPRQASLPEKEESASTSDATTSESTSAPEEEEQDEEEEKQNDSSTSVSTSEESEDEDSQSSEEATATPGAADSESDESPETDSNEEEVVGPDTTTDTPALITAK